MTAPLVPASTDAAAARLTALRSGPGRRPSLALPIVRELAARAIAGRVAAVLRTPDGGPADPDTVTGRLVAVTRHHRDPQAIAEALARHHDHPVDDALMEVLDDFALEMLRAHDRLVAAWVTAHAVRPALAVGDAVRITTNDRAWHRVTVDGEIVGIDAVHARYLVTSEALGHGAGPAAPHARAIPFEDVLAADAAPLSVAA
ncbi:hypothetical protein [Azospirillum halopraeferens]|uniref:hypothetical protein n=1 Tax=Azospirillum halopraeferens TaxID=34010 RepID=UPI0004264670|nr:hypothetical protein [Azospirillum halopraeferens]